MSSRPSSTTDGPGPFLKWAGGKTQLLPAFGELLPELPSRAQGGFSYHEPFLGSGAVFFHLVAAGRPPTAARLSDQNEHLVTCFRVVRDAPGELASRLAELKREHDRDAYYRQRARYNEEPLEDLERAALFIYLNKTGFNGLYRVNRKGGFNVPCGRQAGGPFLPGEALLGACASALAGVEIAHRGFEAVLDAARPGDLVYFDPPYVPLTATAAFTAYAAGGFGTEDQARLAEVFAELARRDCRVMLSNSDTPEVERLYAGFELVRVSARRNINSKGSARGAISELVVRNYR